MSARVRDYQCGCPVAEARMLQRGVVSGGHHSKLSLLLVQWCSPEIWLGLTSLIDVLSGETFCGFLARATSAARPSLLRRRFTLSCNRTKRFDQLVTDDCGGGGDVPAAEGCLHARLLRTVKGKQHIQHSIKSTAT
jgi:hypothetical protein